MPERAVYRRKRLKFCHPHRRSIGGSGERPSRDCPLLTCRLVSIATTFAAEAAISIVGHEGGLEPALLRGLQ
jgi:hypothetical protein